jgi:hypothetical protein
MRELKTEITIDAPIESVWSVLIDSARYPGWNPFITSVEGEFAVNTKLRIRIEPPDSKPMTFRPTCIERTELHRLRWLGSLGVRGLFDGEHIFELAITGEGKTHFIQREKFSGILVPLLWSQIATNTLRGFEAMNRELKSRAEERS